MNRWQTTPIGELVESIKSWNPLRENQEDVFNYIDLSAIDQIDKTIIGAREIICGEAPSRARQLVSEGDILVATVRPNLNGIAKITAEYDGATASTGFCVLRPRSDFLSSNYLFHWVKSPQFVADMVGKATGASYPAVSDKIIRESSIPIPHLTEQHRIAAILDEADALRAKRREVLAQLDNLSHSIFIEMFGDPVKNPKGWNTCSLGGVLSTIRNGINPEQTDDSTGWPISRIETIWNGVIDKTRVRYMVPDEAVTKEFQLKIGDILFSHINSPDHIAKTAIYKGEPSILIHGVNLLRLRGDDATVDPTWLLYFLKHPTTRRFFKTRCKKAVNQASLNQQDIKSLQCIVPPIADQIVFAGRIKFIEHLKEEHRASLAMLDTLFTAIQHRAFRGEL